MGAAREWEGMSSWVHFRVALLIGKGDARLVQVSGVTDATDVSAAIPEDEEVGEDGAVFHPAPDGVPARSPLPRSSLPYPHPHLSCPCQSAVPSERGGPAERPLPDHPR